MILTDIGEIGVHVNGVTYKLRPSLYAMSQLGTPTQIVETYALVMADVDDNKVKWLQFQDALFIVGVCCEQDIDDVFGYFNKSGKFARKLVPEKDIIQLARCLLKHGITGAQKPLPKKADEEPEYLTEFKASESVAIAMAHIGLSEEDAWNMTMTSLVSAMRAKFPPQKDESPGSRAPTKEQHENTMDWFDKIKARREKLH